MSQCSVCHNEVEKRKITYTQWYQGRLVAVEDVDAEVCPVCGEQYFSPKVADEVQEVIENNTATGTMEVPVYRLHEPSRS